MAGLTDEWMDRWMGGWKKLKGLTLLSMVNDVEKVELSYTAGGNGKGNNLFEKWSSSFFKRYKFNNHVTQPSNI